MYMTILKTVVPGLLQILWKVTSVLMWMIASAGSSPRRKVSAGTGEVLLGFKNPLRVFILEDGQWCDVGWSYWQSRETRDKNR